MTSNVSLPSQLMPWKQAVTRHCNAASRWLASITRTTKRNIYLRITDPFFGFRYPDVLDSGHIRLIRLPKAAEPGPRFVMETFAFGACPPYLALSYTWGPPAESSSPYALHDKRLVTLNDSSFYVLPNLYNALVHLTEARPGCYIWIDGICINQASPEERSTQVSIMDLIYHGSCETVVWLGDADAPSMRALEKLEAMAAGARERIMTWGSTQAFGDAFVADDEEALVRNGLPPMSAADWDDMGSVFERTWFSRIWIIQEIALSPAAPSVMIGSHMTPWDTLGNSALMILGSNAIMGLLALRPGAPNFRLVEGVVRASNLQIVREWCRGELDSAFGPVLRATDFAAGTAAEGPGKLLLSLMVASNGCRATVRHDRIYGLLGILNHMAKSRQLTSPGLPVDYTSSEEHVFMNLGLYLYQETQSLHLLSLAGLASRAGTSSTLPTWIPSFENVSAPLMGPNYASLIPYDASRCASPPILRIDGPTLHVQSLAPNLGSVEELGETWPEYTQGSFLKTVTMLLHCGSIYVPTGQPVQEALWRTLIFDQNFVSRPAPPELAPSFKAWFRQITVTGLLKAFLSTRDIADTFDALEPLFVLANRTPEDGLLPTSDEMLGFLKSMGVLRDPSVPILSAEEQHTRSLVLGRESALFEGLLRNSLLVARRLIRTVRGYLGLASFRAEVGDKVAIIKGCPTPLVLRKVSGEAERYQVVGDVYVHGAMFGEFVTEDPSWRNIHLV
ncbi:hypothetical protein N3K66_006949 [Trichothecium roseum]|uniref:Uncharacterized protein n=1 Tax=Trichothecium roseum TaxID=47278 RepID=A0ACC0UWZ3_9HYPO|nr:hypothetical protein N3K66_006949 [Trichothecium roseum]